MLILIWVRRGTLGNRTPNSPTMPDPTEIENMEEAQITAVCNTEVEKAITPRKRKRSEYGTYTPETRAKMARYAIENGPSKAALHFSKEMGREVNESTVRSIKKLFQSSPSKNKLSVLRHSSRGRPLKLGQYDDLVKAYIRRLRVAGGVVNAQIVMTGAKGILMFKDSTLLKENGGTIDITKEWARSLLNRMGFSKRKGTKGIKHFPED